MSYSRDWSTSIPQDHTKFKEQPGHIRDLRTDLQERLSEIIYGFTSGETDDFIGFKKCRLITVGTGTPSAPTGTGTATAIDIYAKQETPSGDADAYLIDKNANEIRLTKSGKLYLDSGRLSNNTWLIGRNSANSADVNILKVNANNEIEFASHPVAPDTGPSSSLQYAPKGYVDGKFDTSTGHDHDGTNSRKISGNQLGAWQTKSYNTVYQADTDGFVIAFIQAGTGDADVNVDIRTDSSNPPTTKRASVDLPGTSISDSSLHSCMSPVKKGDYYKVTRNENYSIVTVYWIPLGS